MSRITALIYFAQSTDGAYLQALEAEKQAIESGLRKAAENGSIRVLLQEDSALTNLSQNISTGGQEVALLHFGGHAQREGLRLQDGTAFSEGLVTQLRSAAQVKLIVLNACSTIDQVKAFLQLPEVIVVATTCPVADRQAAFFAARFYEALGAQRTIQESYQIAVGAMQTRWPEYNNAPTHPTAQLRAFGRQPTLHSIPAVPWQLYYDPEKPELLNWHLPYPRLNTVPNYRINYECVGRESEFQQLTQRLSIQNTPLVIRGIGGTGKSTLAAAWATENRLQYDHLLWVNSTQQLLSFFQQNSNLQHQLQLRSTAPQESATDYFIYALERLKQLPGRNLIILDNIDKQQLLSPVGDRQLWQHLTFPDHWDVLLTTREELPFFEEYYLESLQEAGAAALFHHHYPKSVDQVEMQGLLREIGYHALTIELLAKTLAAMPGLLRLEELTYNIRAFRLNQEDLQEPIFSTHSGQEASVYQQLLFAFQLSSIPEEQQAYLRRRALLPAEPVLVAHLAEIFQSPPIGLNRALNQLSRAGWLRKEEESFSMHRMLQEVVLYQSKPTRSEVEPMRSVLESKFSAEDPTHENRIYWSLMGLPLARWIVVQPKLEENDGFYINRIVDKIQEPIFQENAKFLLEHALPLAEAEEEYVFELLAYFYRTYLALTYRTLGQFEDALEQAEKNRSYTSYQNAMQLLAKLKGEEPDEFINWSVESICSHSVIVGIHLASKDTQQALRENQKMLELISKTMPRSPDDPRIPIIITTLIDLIQILQAEGDHLNTLELSTSAQSLPYDHPFFLYAQAKSLTALGRFTEADPIYQAVLQRHDFQRDQYSYLNATEEYALALDANGQPEKALNLYYFVLKQKPFVLPDQHPEIAQTHLFLAMAHYRLFQLPEAEQHLRRAITEFSIYPHMFAQASYTLALVLQSAEKYAASTLQLDKTIAAYEQLEGDTSIIFSCMLHKVKNELKSGKINQARIQFAQIQDFLSRRNLKPEPYEQEQIDMYSQALAES